MDDTGSPVTARSDATAGPEMCFSPPRQTVSYPKVPAATAAGPLRRGCPAALGCVSDTIFPLQSKIKILLLEGVSDEAVNILKQEGFNVRARPQRVHTRAALFFDLCGRHLYSILLFLYLLIYLFAGGGAQGEAAR